MLSATNSVTIHLSTQEAADLLVELRDFDKLCSRLSTPDQAQQNDFPELFSLQDMLEAVVEDWEARQMSIHQRQQQKAAVPPV